MVKTGPPDFFHATVMEYMIDGYLVTEERIGQIFELMPHLDVELIALLNGIQQCEHWLTMSFVSRHPIGNADLSNFCPGLLDYQEAAMRLSKYLDERADKPVNI